ncbi:MAG: hypothetical protein WBE26_01535 [Phycisphaerae bacterium]
MSVIINIGSVSRALPPALAPTSIPSSQSPVSQTSGGDRVKLSRCGPALTHAEEGSSFCTARTRAIRAEILDGTYETPERINGTVERLLDVIV